jgi:diacylglycerol kinase (ATP)
VTPATVVIWNPEAGRKAGLRTNSVSEDELRRVMRDHGLGEELFESTSSEAANARVDQAVRDGAKVIVAAGGDGTARGIGFRLLGSDTALGILPLGSAMNVARSLGIPRELDRAAAIIAAGHVRRIDVGYVGDRPFLEIVSIGLSAEAFARAQEIDHRRWGSIVQLLRLLLRGGRTRIVLDVDGEAVQTRALALAIANGPYTGLGIELAPQARLHDGQLDVVIFEGLSAWGLGRHMLARIGGREGKAERFRTLKGSRIRIDARRPLPVRFDNEDGGRTPVEIRVGQDTLAILSPREDTASGD